MGVHREAFLPQRGDQQPQEQRVLEYPAGQDQPRRPVRRRISRDPPAPRGDSPVEKERRRPRPGPGRAAVRPARPAGARDRFGRGLPRGPAQGRKAGVSGREAAILPAAFVRRARAGPVPPDRWAPPPSSHRSTRPNRAEAASNTRPREEVSGELSPRPIMSSRKRASVADRRPSWQSRRSSCGGGQAAGQQAQGRAQRVQDRGIPAGQGEGAEAAQAPETTPVGLQELPSPDRPVGA